MNRTHYIGVDIGGTHVSCALIDAATGEISGEIHTSYVDCNGDSSGILHSWKSAINKSMSESNSVIGVGLAIPGPFNYAKGISTIEGVKKFDSMFGLNVKKAICSDLKEPGLPLTFINDASAFALGEYYCGAVKGNKKALVITLGTGFGSTFLIDGQVQQTATDEIPPDGYLYNIPFGKSVSDDYFSSRWFINTWLKITGKTASGVKEIAQFAIQGNEYALAVFEQFSVNLAEFIAPWLKKFNPETLVIGGSIAKAYTLFLDRLTSLLKEKNLGHIAVKTCELWDKAPVIGAAMNVQSALEMEKKEKQYRKTGQFLAPAKVEASPQGDYDIYPGFPIGSDKIKQGCKLLAEWIIQYHTIVIDGYVGVFWNQLIEEINTELIRNGKKTHWYHAESAMKSPEEINEMLNPYLGEENSIFGKITDKQLIDWFDTNKLKKIQPDADVDINILIGCGAALAGWKAPLIYVDLPKNELQFRMRAGTAFNLGVDKQYDFREMYKRFYFADWVALNHHKAAILPKIDVVVDEQRPDSYLWMSGNDLRDGLASMSRHFFRARPWFEPGAWGGSWMKEHISQLNKDVPNLAWSFELMVLENGIMFESNAYRLEVSFDFLMYNNYKEVLGDCAEQFKYDFPIRFDFLDTFDGGNLSVQCHPRPEYIKEQFGMPFTQDETYYILDCKNEPVVYLGFQEGINPNEFHKALIYSQKNSKKIDIEKYIQKHFAKKHDLFLIPNGTIHASGKDNLVLEISSAPYIFTFKMYDWMRLDLDGRPRPMNIEHGMKNVYFERQGETVQNELISKPLVIEENRDVMIEHMPTHPKHFYDVYRYTFNNSIHIETKNKCHVWMLVEGDSIILETADGMKQRFNYAETFVVPADAKSYKITNEGKTKAMMVKAFVK